MRVVLKDIPTSRQMLLKAANVFANENGTVLLYSGGNFTSSKQSFLFLFPVETISIKGAEAVKTKREETLHVAGNPWDALVRWLPKKNDGPGTPLWVGYFGYEMGAFSDLQKHFEMLPSPYRDAYFQRSSALFIVDHHENKGKLLINEEEAALLEPAQQKLLKQLRSLQFWEGLLEDPVLYPSCLQIRHLEKKEEYIQKIQAIKELIFSGEVYQVNLSQQILLKGSADPFSLFHAVALFNPAPFSAFLNLPDLQIASSSPERFLLYREGMLEARPIKGTVPRGKNEKEDMRMRLQLIHSEKEQAELLMITDLLRNDLGKISLPGSVKADDVCILEAYTNVYHMLSIIRSQPLPSLHPVEMVRACFPGGSITGCPKLRAMEIISTIEMRPRGIYTGSIGYFAENGDFDFNLAIRTAVFKDNCVDIQLGGAIVADSIPEAEYAETLQKGISLLQALRQCI